MTYNEEKKDISLVQYREELHRILREVYNSSIDHFSVDYIKKLYGESRNPRYGAMKVSADYELKMA